MKVRVRFHDAVRERVAGWRNGLSENPDDAYLLATTYLRLLQERLVAAGGMPRDALRVEGLEPPSFWCELCGGAWVRCEIAEETRRLWWVLSRTIEITGLESEPPDAVRPTSRRS